MKSPTLEKAKGGSDGDGRRRPRQGSKATTLEGRVTSVVSLHSVRNKVGTDANLRLGVKRTKIVGNIDAKVR